VAEWYFIFFVALIGGIVTKRQIAIGGLMFITSLGTGAVYADTVNRYPSVQSQEATKETVQAVDTNKPDSPKAKEGSTIGGQADAKGPASAVSPKEAVRICPITGKILR